MQLFLQCEDIGKIKYMKYKSMPFLNDDFNDPRTQAFCQPGAKGGQAYPRTKELLHVTTKLCSTKFTQTCKLDHVLHFIPIVMYVCLLL